MPFNKEELEKVRANVTVPMRKTLADEFNLSYGSIKNILAGLANNDAVIIRAVALIEDKEIIMNSTKQTIASL